MIVIMIIIMMIIIMALLKHIFENDWQRLRLKSVHEKKTFNTKFFFLKLTSQLDNLYGTCTHVKNTNNTSSKLLALFTE